MLMMTTGGFQTLESMTKDRGRATTQLLDAGTIETA